MRYPWIILVLLQTFAGYGQERFYHLVEGWSNNHSFEYNNGYGALGLEIVGSPFDHRYVFDFLDFEGTSLNQSYFFVDSLESTSFGSNGSNNVLELEAKLVIASYIGNTSASRLYGSLFDYTLPDGPMEIIATYDFDLFNQLVAVADKNDSTLLIGGLLSDNEGYNRGLIMDTDMEGEVRWTFESACGIYCLSRIQQVLPLSDGGIGVLFYEFDASLPTWEETKRSVLLKLSAEGVEEWRSYLGDWEDFQIDPGGMVEVDGEIIVSYTDTDIWDEDAGPQGQYVTYHPNTVHLAYFSLEGGLEAEVSLLDQIPNGIVNLGRYKYEISQMQLLDDGNLLLTGTTRIGAFILKTSTDGLVHWSREHLYIPWDFSLNANQQDNYIYHALPTSDGGFLCTGEYLHYPVVGNPTSEQSAIALKVDEFGCLEPGCQLADGLFEDEIGTLAAYPNPTSGELRVLLPSGLSISNNPSNTAVEVFDAMGRAIPDSRFSIQNLNGSSQESVILNLESLPSGAYLVRIVTEQGLYSARILKE